MVSEVLLVYKVVGDSIKIIVVRQDYIQPWADVVASML